ncbi:MAG: hypothetical protein KBT21_10005, partial [Treponema sp.]|nr:hypothetical protein [Candidatus Treponema merdequi]
EKLEILSSVQALEVLSGNSSAAVSKLKAITKSNAAVTHEEEVSTDGKNDFFLIMMNPLKVLKLFACR